MADGIVTLTRSKLKVQILKSLTNEALTPSMISKLIKRPRPSVSRAITELEKQGFVACMNPSKDRWRFFKITRRGEKALKAAERFL